MFEKYRPVDGDVEAVQVTDENAREIAQLVRGVLVDEIDPFDSSITRAINVPTALGNRRAHRGDYVVFYRGQCSVYTERVFEATYLKA